MRRIKMKIIDKSWVKPLSLGSVVLGSGGGGKTNNLVFLLEDILTKNIEIQMLDLEDLNSKDYYCSTGMIGSTQLIDDFYFSGHEGVETVKSIEKLTRKNIKGIFTLEAAGVNTLYPLAVAGLMGIPVVDADCMGRAFPEIQMTVFQIENEDILPFILNDTRNKTHIFDKEETFIVDLNIRKILNEIDNLGFFSCAVKDGNSLKERLIPETISFTRDIGEVFIEETNYESILKKLIFITKNSVYGAAIELFKGEIKVIDKNTGSNWQTINLDGIEDYSKKEYKIMNKNEYLISFIDGEISCMVPDIIVTIDIERLIPVNIEDIRKNMKIAVLGIPAPINLKTNKALNIVGPTSFGYKSTYKPLEKTYYNYYY